MAKKNAKQPSDRAEAVRKTQRAAYGKTHYKIPRNVMIYVDIHFGAVYNSHGSEEIFKSFI